MILLFLLARCSNSFLHLLLGLGFLVRVLGVLVLVIFLVLLFLLMVLRKECRLLRGLIFLGLVFFLGRLVLVL